MPSFVLRSYKPHHYRVSYNCHFCIVECGCDCFYSNILSCQCNFSVASMSALNYNIYILTFLLNTCYFSFDLPRSNGMVSRCCLLLALNPGFLANTSVLASERQETQPTGLARHYELPRMFSILVSETRRSIRAECIKLLFFFVPRDVIASRFSLILQFLLSVNFCSVPDYKIYMFDSQISELLDIFAVISRL